MIDLGLLEHVRGGNVALFGPTLLTTPAAGSPITTYSGGQPTPPASGVPPP